MLQRINIAEYTPNAPALSYLCSTINLFRPFSFI